MYIHCTIEVARPTAVIVLGRQMGGRKGLGHLRFIGWSWVSGGVEK